MNFNTLEYLLFLPLICLGFWLLPQKIRWMWLLLGSWLFYFWWDPRAGALLIGTTAVTWFCAMQIGKTNARAGKRLWMLLALGTALGILSVFKYAGFLASLIGASLPLRIMLPVGISFYTFQTLGYVLDVYRGTVPPEPHFGYYALFVSFFPQLVAGPIERTEHLLPQLKQSKTRDPMKFRQGIWLLLTGFFKKSSVPTISHPMWIRCSAIRAVPPVRMSFWLCFCLASRSTAISPAIRTLPAEAPRSWAST